MNIFELKQKTKVLGNSQISIHWKQASASNIPQPDPDFTLVKYTPLTEQHRKWLQSIPLKFISSGERQVVMNVLRTKRYNEPTRDVLNRIRETLMKEIETLTEKLEKL